MSCHPDGLTHNSELITQNSELKTHNSYKLPLLEGTSK